MQYFTKVLPVKAEQYNGNIDDFKLVKLSQGFGTTALYKDESGDMRSLLVHDWLVIYEDYESGEDKIPGAIERFSDMDFQSRYQTFNIARQYNKMNKFVHDVEAAWDLFDNEDTLNGIEQSIKDFHATD